jgi:hypothetical protein
MSSLSSTSRRQWSRWYTSAEGYCQQEAEQELHSRQRRPQFIQELDPLAFELTDIGLDHVAAILLSR